MRLTSTIPLALLATFTAATVAPRAAQPRAASPLTIEQLIDIKHPSNPVWSRDSKRVAFTWERAGVANLYLVPADGSAKPTQLTTDGVPGGIFWSADSTSILFFRGPTLMAMALDGSAPKARFADFAGRSPSVSRDGTRIVYLMGGAGGAGEVAAAAGEAAVAGAAARARQPHRTSRHSRRNRRRRRRRRRFGFDRW